MRILVLCLLLVVGCGGGNTKSNHTDRILPDRVAASAYDDGFVMSKLGKDENPYSGFNDSLRRYWNQGYYDANESCRPKSR